MGAFCTNGRESCRTYGLRRSSDVVMSVPDGSRVCRRVCAAGWSGVLTNPDATTNCGYCPYASGTEYLAGMNIKLGQRQRDFGIFRFLFFILFFELGACLFLYIHYSHQGLDLWVWADLQVVEKGINAFKDMFILGKGKDSEDAVSN
ncbi:hypothetical protein QBC33DRAFT_317752 [Phialemonium atrogriseum]|uniref:Uncharacterized protein n=1 Tax=Phialemonium atrogriseum TaxID=1093897 RepID=A0AAJ0FAT4_9PEZI|nr:uncharacterized protein QBC33DRAFT_317752 [Phialemonium atrogriseum]KAK1761726.1 hypothetical protein QBC33DRAFT_317752 [Phialemonium atrogriseum]